MGNYYPYVNLKGAPASTASPAKNEESCAPLVEEFECPVINADCVDLKKVLGDVCPCSQQSRQSSHLLRISDSNLQVHSQYFLAKHLPGWSWLTPWQCQAVCWYTGYCCSHPHSQSHTRCWAICKCLVWAQGSNLLNFLKHSEKA